MSNQSGRYADFDDYGLKRIENGWIVEVRGNHTLKGTYFFDERDDAERFINTKSSFLRRHSSGWPRTVFLFFVFVALLYWILA